MVVGDAMVLGNFLDNLAYSKAKTYCACSRCGLGLFDVFCCCFFSHLSFLFFLGVVRWCWVNFQCRGVLPIWIRVGQGPPALAVGACGGCLDIFSLVCHFSFLFPSLWETARYRLKYCLKGPLSPKQPTNYLFFVPLSGRQPHID